MIEKRNADIKQKIIKLTLAMPLNKNELKNGDSINVNFDRVQAFGKVSKAGVHQGLTLLIMNTSDQVIYVHESPKEIKDQVDS